MENNWTKEAEKLQVLLDFARELDVSIDMINDIVYRLGVLTMRAFDDETEWNEHPPHLGAR